MDLKDQATHALEMERHWRKQRQSMDDGSYCESAEPKFNQAGKIIRLYQGLIEELLKFEREFT